MVKSLRQMQAEIKETNLEKGWYDEPVSFLEAMALLHSEISEAVEAWRRWGVRDTTAKYRFNDEPWPPKPEGVGSEFADILIRLLDDCERWHVDLETKVSRLHGEFGFRDSFLENMNALHTYVSRASEFWAISDADDAKLWLGAVLKFLRQCCAEYGINLEAEYERKAAYNRTRSYRHGGKLK